ncbi:hypothetical protein CAPTEDRAFT_194998 [Capitella teleta]|uniref:Uncharacterized protein n=1 Tax=Capitella teleta TaxID=283909 RepID=R7UJ54_CAPTE|nr:hypothetical protein CAPTEDRAFT_194998 [Capitella teleta]|eukprot:ELU06564.1 hypothetical protein CAPTEDRAFT_194998 [Capitella teleta]
MFLLKATDETSITPFLPEHDQCNHPKHRTRSIIYATEHFLEDAAWTAAQMFTQEGQPCATGGRQTTQIFGVVQMSEELGALLALTKEDKTELARLRAQLADYKSFKGDMNVLVESEHTLYSSPSGTSAPAMETN